LYICYNPASDAPSVRSDMYYVSLALVYSVNSGSSQALLSHMHFHTSVRSSGYHPSAVPDGTGLSYEQRIFPSLSNFHSQRLILEIPRRLVPAVEYRDGHRKMGRIFAC
jgi:hypothetical protein